MKPALFQFQDVKAVVMKRNTLVTWRHLASYKFTDVSEEHVASIFWF
jgi:hypothetical protein